MILSLSHPSGIPVFSCTITEADMLSPLKQVRSLAEFYQQQESIDWLSEMYFLHRTFYLIALCMLIHIIVSLGTPAVSDDQIRDDTWSRSIFQVETIEMKSLPWYQNYRILSLIFLILTALIIGQFM